jgi:parallel beta-helix repeat protein
VNDRDGYSGVTLRGGLIEGFVEGAQFVGTHDITVLDLIAKGHWDDGVFFDRVVGALVANSRMVNDYRGVEADNSRKVLVHDIAVVNIQHAGIAYFTTTDSVIRDNTADMGLGDYGIEIVNSSHDLITHNQIRQWGFDGILVAGASGIFVANVPAEANSFVENTLRNGTGFGMELIQSDSGVVRNNLVASNSIIGTVASTSPQPDGSGIEVDAVISADGQGNPPYQYLTGVGPTGNRIRDNVSNGNALDGIHLEAAGNLVAGNIANRNGNWGIFAVAGNTDGGGNRATGNGQAAQCRRVRCAS